MTDITKDNLNSRISAASPERLQTIETLLGMSDERVAKYGDALSLLLDAEYDVTVLKQAMKDVMDARGTDIIRLRTKVRVFKFPKDEDDLKLGFTYRAFYVKTITSEQKIAIQQRAAEKTKYLVEKGVSLDDESPESALKSLVEIIKSDQFATFLSDPNNIYRKIVTDNTVEVLINDEGVVKKPIVEVSRADGEIIPESVYASLEEDLRYLIDEQNIMGKNSQMADMLGS